MCFIVIVAGGLLISWFSSHVWLGTVKGGGGKTGS